MVHDVSAPVSIAVIAVALDDAPDNPAKARVLFPWLCAQLSVLGALVADPAGTALTLALAPGDDVANAIATIDGAIGEFEEQCPPARLRALAHYGTAFRATGPDGRPGFQGSAVRSALNLLRRTAAPAGFYATPDFARFAGSLKRQAVFELMAEQPYGLSPLLVVQRRKLVTSELHSTDPELILWLKARLAKDLGPFASPLVDNASHSTRTARELAAAVGHEIVNPRQRQHFDADVFRYLESRNG